MQKIDLDRHNKLTISVITTTWNRAKYLARVQAGLAGQTYKNFEWIVADDGSEDNTEQVVRELASKSSFPVTYIRASVHVGKARMDNEAIMAARGEFVAWCDSDDYFLPHAFESFMNAWESIPYEMRIDYVGITGFCATEDGVLNRKIKRCGESDITWNELATMKRMDEDTSLFVRSDLMKNNKFPEVDHVIPESVVWSAISNMKTRVVSIPLKVVEYKADNCISFSGKMRYNKGRAYSLALSTKNYGLINLSFGEIIWKTINFIRYCIHGDIKVKEAVQLWRGNTSLILLAFCFFPASLIAIKDKLERKVEKTHIQFEQAIKIVSINIAHLNPVPKPEKNSMDVNI